MEGGIGTTKSQQISRIYNYICRSRIQLHLSPLFICMQPVAACCLLVILPEMDDKAELDALDHIMSDACAEPIKLSYGLMRSITDNFSNEIGRGGFGVVYKGILQNGDVAVKKLYNPHALPDKKFLDEITCLKKAKHKNIVRFLGYCSETQGEVFEYNGVNIMAEVHNKLLCFEYVPGGNIQDYLEQEKPHGEDWHVQYQMIRGICQGLDYLHEQKISHLDLKPENVMLDAHMEPKITDFGLSRFLDQEQSKVITQNIIGTPRYIAPEIIDNGEISLMSDIYALGIIIMEILTGISRVCLDNWDESLDMDCPRVRRCAEIARNCTDHDKHNRPTVHEIIGELKSMISLPSINQDTSTACAFPGTDLLDVYPLQLRFPFSPNKEMHCHLALTNKTDCDVYCRITPDVPDRYRNLSGNISCFNDGFVCCMSSMSTKAITICREAQEDLPTNTDNLEIQMLIVGPNANKFASKLYRFGSCEEVSSEDLFFRAVQEDGWEMHRTVLTVAVIVDSKDGDGIIVVDKITKEDDVFRISGMDVHPTEPWVLLVDNSEAVCIWNWQTNEKIGEYKLRFHVPGYHGDMIKFISRKQWIVIGNDKGSILVRTCPAMDLVKEFKAHHDCVASLAVHPTRPLLLSSSGESMSLKIWDWNSDWSCTRVFDNTGCVKQMMFNPKHTSTFATITKDGYIEMWRIGHPDPIATIHHQGNVSYCGFFTYCGDQDFIAAAKGPITTIWDILNRRHVHELNLEYYGLVHDVAVVSQPTHPVLVTAAKDGTIHVWDSTTYRLKKVYMNLRSGPLHIGFTGSRRLVIGNTDGISILDIDLE